MPTIESAIRHGRSKIYRRCFIKRRSAITGAFEDEWQEITSDIKRWGTIRMSTDSTQRGRLTLDGMRIVVNNDQGKYNPNTREDSFWYGYMGQQRTLVRINAGYIHPELGSNGIWRNAYMPGLGTWDQSLWDQGLWDETEGAPVFTGIISGEVFLSSGNEVTFQVKPLSQIFKDYPAANISGLTGGLTASQVMTLLRDHTDGSGNLVFRPFIGNTTSAWDISTTTNTYAYLTATAKGILDKTVWDLVEKLAGAENRVVFVDQAGEFKFIQNTAAASVVYEFHGLGSYDPTYGNSIKQIDSWGKDFAGWYSRVQIKHKDADTSTSYWTKEATYTVDGDNLAYELGFKTYSYENTWINTTAMADTIANDLYADLMTVRNIIKFKTSFIPHLNILDRVKIYYDSTQQPERHTLWDLNAWDTELEWDSSRGDAIVIDGSEFKFLSIEMNLDTMENTFIGREI